MDSDDRNWGVRGLLGLALLLAVSLAGAESSVTAGSRAADEASCVAPTAQMRRNHMDYLSHDRDLTVIGGVRDTDYSLAACVDCHAERAPSGGYKPVNAEGQFCASCHSYVAVSLTCFQCHSKVPGGETPKQALVPSILGQISASSLSATEPDHEQ